MLEKSVYGSTANVAVLDRPMPVLEMRTEQAAVPQMSQLIPGFLKHGQFDRCLSPETIRKYEECLRMIVRDLGDLPVGTIRLPHLTELKSQIIGRGAGEARVGSMVFALKSFLRYCKDFLELDVLDPDKILPPKRHRREVLFLTNEEVEAFVNAIKIKNNLRCKNPVRLDGLRFRTLVEVLLGTGMRISEALSLGRDSINFEKKEAKIIGKGSKERTVFLNDRAIGWLQRYLLMRKDSSPALFVTFGEPKPLKAHDLSKQFKHYAQKVGLKKKVTPHILRHTAATLMSHNGADIRNIQLILGHSDIKTTAKYYLGVDKEALKEAHAKFLKYD